MSVPSDFIDFAEGIGKGLVKAYISDIDVFLLFTAGGLIGARSRHLRGIGTALLIYTAYRRGDQYVSAIVMPRPASNFPTPGTVTSNA